MKLTAPESEVEPLDQRLKARRQVLACAMYIDQVIYLLRQLVEAVAMAIAVSYAAVKAASVAGK